VDRVAQPGRRPVVEDVHGNAINRLRAWRDVVDRISDGSQVLEISSSIRNRPCVAQLLLEGLDQLDQGQWNRRPVLGEGEPSVMVDGSISKMSASGRESARKHLSVERTTVDVGLSGHEKS